MFIWQAWRSWYGSRTVALLAAAALAVGIGSATAIYSVVNGVMLKPLPYADADRFVALFGGTVTDPDRPSVLLGQDARVYQDRTRVFDAFGWYREAGKNLTFAGEPHHVEGVRVTPSLVQQLGVQPVLGQWFQDDRGVVLSSWLWRQLGGDPGIIGKALTLDGSTFTVTGVMPESFRLPVAGVTSAGVRTGVWMPLDPRETGGGFVAYGRRKPGVSFADAQSDVARVAAEIAAEDPVNHPAYTARLFDLRETVIKDIRPTLLLLFAAAGLLFLITCANTAGLLLARAIARARETAIRVALGAGRGQLGAQYFAEGLLVALAGAAGGVVLSVLLTPAIVSMAADHLPRAGEIALDWTILLFALAAALVASALSSLAPLWQAGRTAPADVLRDGARASAGARSRRLSRSLVVAEVAVAFALLTVGVVLILALRNLSRISPGFDAEQVLTFVLSVPGEVADDPGRRIPLQQRLIEGLRTIPGVADVAFANQLPFKGCCRGTAIYPEGQPADLTSPQRLNVTGVSTDYFRAMRIPLLSGRLLTDQDVREGFTTVVINQAAAKRYWGDRDPVGAYGRFGNPRGSRFQVAGVVGDVKNDGLDNPAAPEIYLPGAVMRVEGMNFVVRSSLTSPSLIPEIRRIVRGIDPEQPIQQVATMKEIIRQTMTLDRLASIMTAFFAGAAVLLAMLGVYGVVSYAVRQRTVEIGTRMAMGATSAGVLALILGDGLKMAVYGVLAGGVVAVGAAVYLGSVFRIGGLGPAPFLYSTMIIGAVAFTASFVPAWRASALSPMVAIRNQPESMWQNARLTMRRALQQLSAGGEATVVPLGTLISEFAESVRRAASFPEALQVALAALRERSGARSITLLDKVSADEYRSASLSIPAHGILVNRLRHYPHPLALTRGDFATWAQWARDFRPEHLDEIERLARAGVRMAVPLRTKNEIAGVLLLDLPDGRESFSSGEKEMLGSAAEVFALMIENARLNDRALEQEKIRRDLALAADVQRGLLPPHAPRCGAATLAAFTLPARTVGGDYYDFLPLPEERIGIAVADIAGKGIAAALLTSAVQASLRVILSEGDVDPARLAARMNSFLHRATGTNKYATFFYAQFDPRLLQLRYVNAGHNPPYLLRRTATGVETRELTTGGMVLGLFPEVEYDDAVIELRPGDLFVAFTDGVTEALNGDGEEFGEERLKDLLRGALGGTADETSAALANGMRAWIGDAEQYDDLTCVVVAVNSSEGPY